MTESVVLRTLLTSSRRRSQHTELWREIPGWPGYDVSDDGRVRWASGENAGNLLTQSPSTTAKWNRWPYACVRLGKFVDGKRVWRHIRVHRAVMAAFEGPLPLGMEVHHKDGDHWNNRLDNLEYVTKQVNEDYAQPLRPRGSRHHAAKLTEDAIREIRAVPFGGNVAELVRKFGVSRSCLTSIRSGQTWKHVA